jgi:molybdopterin-binding protein
MNSFEGRIVQIQSHESVAIVDISDGINNFTVTMLGQVHDLEKMKIGRNVKVFFSEMEVALAKNLEGYISMRNRFLGVVTKIESGELLTRIVFVMNGIEISSVITTRSAKKLALKLGDQIEGLVKSNEMNIELMEVD